MFHSEIVQVIVKCICRTNCRDQEDPEDPETVAMSPDECHERCDWQVKGNLSSDSLKDKGSIEFAKFCSCVALIIFFLTH